MSIPAGIPWPTPIFDSHLHIIDPRFPLAPNQGFVPDAFTVGDYRSALVDLGLNPGTVVGGAVVSGSFQGLVARGAWVKASGLGRLDFDPVPALRAIYRENPAALLFGSDLPGTRASRPIDREDLRQIADSLGDALALHLVFHDNAVSLYRPPSLLHP